MQVVVVSGTSYVIPSAGVITSWSVQDDPSTVSGLKLKVGRLVAHSGSESDYKIVGESVAGAQTPNGVSTFLAHIPVQAGDILGEFSNGGDCEALPTDTDDLQARVAGDQAAGTTASFHSPFFEGARSPIQATVEPDADGDGFGDETQDQCPGIAGTVDGCLPTTPPPASTPPSASGSTPAPDQSPPAVSASIRKLLRLSKKGTISFTLRSGEQATGSATGTISLPKASRVVRFRTAKLKLSANKRRRVTLRLSKRSLKTVRKALKHHRLKTKLTVTLKDAAGNKSVKRLTTKVKR